MKLRKLVVILMALLMVSSLAVAYDEFAGDTAPPGRMGGGKGSILMNKTLSVGAYIAYHLSETIEWNGEEIFTQDMDETFVGLSAKFFFLMNGKLGATLDATLLSTTDVPFGVVNSWMVDFGVAYRTMLTRKLMAIGGIGYSQAYYSYVSDSGLDDDSEWGDVGWYVKAGAEYFISDNITIGGSFKWTTFEDEDAGDTMAFKYLNFELSVNYYL